MRKTELLDKYARDGDSRLLLARVLDQWQRAEQRGVPTHTGFLSPAEQAVSADLLMAVAPGQGILAGGYPDAERRLWAFLPDWLEEETWQQGEECPLCALEVETPPGAGLTHRDYLGSLMGLGLTREKLGDILLSQQGAQVVVATGRFYGGVPGELLELPFYLTERDANYRRLLDRRLAAHGRSVIPALESSYASFLLQVLEQTEGLAYLPWFLVEERVRRGRLGVVEVEDLQEVMYGQIFSHKEKWTTREMEEFVRLCARAAEAGAAAAL